MQTFFTLFWSTAFPVPICLVFSPFCLCFWVVLDFLFHFHIFCGGVHFPFAHVFHVVVAAVREQVVTAVEKQHTDSVHPRSIFHIFIFLIHGFPWPPWLIFCCFPMFLMVCAGFSWFSMFSFFFSICFPWTESLQNGKHRSNLGGTLYKMENMGRTLGGPSTKSQTWVEPWGDPLQNPNHGSKMVLLGPKWSKQ